MSGKRIVLTFALAGILALVGCGKETNDNSQPGKVEDQQSVVDGQERYSDEEAGEASGSLDVRDEERVLIEEIRETPSSFYDSRWEYNPDGTRKIGYYKRSKDDYIAEIEKYETDGSGRILSREAFNVDQYDPVNGTYRLGSSRQRITYEYDGDVYVAKLYDEDGIIQVEDTYDAHENCLSRKEYEDGILDEGYYESNEFSYDSEGNLINSTEYFSGGNGFSTRTRRTVNEYDSEGRLMHSLSTYEGKNLSGQENLNDRDRTYQYDELGRVTKVEYGPEDVNPGRYELHYYDTDEAMKPSRVEVRLSSGTVANTFFYSYDIDGETLTYQREESSSGETIDEHYWVYAYLSDVVGYQMLTEI